MKFKNKKAAIFDLDGTISNTLGALTEAINLTFEFFGYPKCSELQVKNAIGNGAKMLIKRLVPQEIIDDEKLVEKVLEKYNSMYALTYMHTENTYDGIKETVKNLSDRGIKVAVFSNKQDEYVKALCKMYFPNGQISCARGQTELPVKPDIAGLKMVLKNLEVNYEDCIFIGDSGVDIKTAKNADMDFIGVSWGFVGRKGLSDLGAKVIVDTPEEIAKLIN